MKTIRILIFFSIIALFQITCKKDEDPCENIKCLNGGTCANGLCNCLPGWTGSDCNTKIDPCANIKCLNGGTCANGLCNCLPGWTGSDCGIQKTPSKIVIKRIQITKFPTTESNGGGWDPFDGPDIFVKLSKGSSTIWSSPNRYPDVSAQSVYTFDPISLEITSLNDNYRLEVWDYDTLDPDDFMGEINFKIYNSANGFPSELSVNCNNCTTAFKVFLTYVF